MKKKTKILSAVALLLFGATSYAQVSSPTNNSTIPPQFVGYNGAGPGGPKDLEIRNDFNRPITVFTNNIQRMKINGNTPTTSGFIGIGTSNPLFRLHVDGFNTGSATNAGWTKGILMSNSAALMWKGSPNTNLNYFMAHSSTSPLGDFYQGISERLQQSRPLQGF